MAARHRRQAAWSIPIPSRSPTPRSCALPPFSMATSPPIPTLAPTSLSRLPTEPGGSSTSREVRPVSPGPGAMESLPIMRWTGESSPIRPTGMRSPMIYWPCLRCPSFRTWTIYSIPARIRISGGSIPTAAPAARAGSVPARWSSSIPMAGREFRSTVAFGFTGELTADQTSRPSTP